MRLTFKGGVHPFEGKEMSKDCPVEKYLPKSDLAYPLSSTLVLRRSLWLQRVTMCLLVR